MTAEKTIKLYDCTLRDGAQGPGINYSLQDKLHLVRSLDDFGMDYIEAGWPGSNPKDTSLYEELAKVTFKNAKLAETLRQGASMEKILFETDAPYLAPVPYRGRRNEPLYIWKTVEKVAATFEITIEEAVEKARNNAEALFKNINLGH